ncbi:hypothetical protein JVT61DRAFT_5659 [Boletus reticuloceps]|uniref:DH domain-containing protein n=1 Tax=Boletus reticuloceps TaxID=495285 RepID=A0A8I2YZZ0_9AGAM|nr:hypothetical protein JVT61DRAFT_5659 [Boletus reticuloceps]
MGTKYLGESSVVISGPPPPPPKDKEHANTALPIMSSASLGLDIPLSPVSPSSLFSPVDKTRKSSPLTDLIASEKTYVEILTGIIRNVAAAWSRSNLPPPQLDLMFRSVEGVYKTNRTLLTKLKEIGENPSSPKALGDLLMRWIDELEQPYMTYADRYCIGFDDWQPVKSNPKLPTVLQGFSVSNPPPSLPQPTHLPSRSLWTLDALFLLPKGRLQYYRKLYSKLLKSTTPGRSDHRLLTGALVKLDDLLATLDERANTNVGILHPPQMLAPLHVNMEGSSISMVPSTNESMEGALLSGHFGTDSASAAPSTRGSLSSRDERLSQETALTSLSRESSQHLSSPVLDLERRLTTEDTLDIFTMQPKQIRLQIAPPTLPYAREFRLSAKVVVRLTPKATGVEVVHHHGHLFILSDLFLLCEEIAQERVARSDDGKDMRLCYPPLSGKVLNVIEVPGQENALQVSIMRKETLIMEADSRFIRDRILNEFQECISFAKTISRATQEPVPPLPLISNPPQSPVTRLAKSDSSSRQRPDRPLNPRLVLQSQPVNLESGRTDSASSKIDRTIAASSPTSNYGSPVTSLSRTPSEQQNVVPTPPETIQDPRRDVVSGPRSSPASPRNGPQAPTLHNPGPVHPPRRSSAGHARNSPPSSFVPGQIVPPVWSAHTQSQSPPSVMAMSDLPGGPKSAYPPPAVQNPIAQNSILRHHTSMHSLRQQPLQHQPPLQPLPHRPSHQEIAPAPHPKLGPHFSNGQTFPTHPSSPPVTSHPVEQPSHRLQNSPSSRSLHAQYQYNKPSLPPVPSLSDGLPTPQRPYSQRKESMGSLNMPMSRTILPSMQMGSRTNSVSEPSILDPSPPASPVEKHTPLGAVRSVITAQMKCKVFHQQQHAQWKSLGSANLTLYRQEPTNVKQLVVETGSKEKSVLISTIVLTDGVERVGKTGVAIELSDAGGARTGVIYMIQLRNEDSASGLFKTLLAGSDRVA